MNDLKTVYLSLVNHQQEAMQPLLILLCLLTVMQLSTGAQTRLALSHSKRNAKHEWEKSGWFYDVENMLREIDEQAWAQQTPTVNYE